MPVKRDRKSGRWIYDEYVTAADGTSERIKGRAPKFCNTKRAADDVLRDRRGLIENGTLPSNDKPAILYSDWFDGRFWREWVIGQRNKPTECKSKRTIYKCHLEEFLGPLTLDEIDTAVIAQLRALLVEKGLSDKRINNILSVLSKSLRYAFDVKVLDEMPHIGHFKVEAPEIEPWEFDDYVRIVEAARDEGPDWHAAVCLAGEAGFRSGEIKALNWEKHVDGFSKMLMIKEQTCYGVTTTPKGRTRRAVPMTATVEAALAALPGPRRGYVVRNADGTAKTDGQFNAVILRICERAGLPLKRWHRLRHTFGTHAAMCGVNPWTLQLWMGHKGLEETQRYVHLATERRRPLPPRVIAAGQKENDPDARVIAMLGARVPNGTTTQAQHTHLPMKLAS
jgi:integrase